VFSGIVQVRGRVVESRPTAAGTRLVIEPDGWDHRPAPGESICVSGVCLTVAADPGANGRLAFDVVPETLAKTTLGSLRAGGRVNLERSVRAMDLMSGHLVQGHVDGVGTVEAVTDGSERRVRVALPTALMEYMVPKGSVAIDGVSLTLAAVDPRAGAVEVALIPTTLELTTLGDLKPGGRVNIEADIIAKTVVHWLRQRQANRAD
jgi:riboflavin synthase alpha subunit